MRVFPYASGEPGMPILTLEIVRRALALQPPAFDPLEAQLKMAMHRPPPGTKLLGGEAGRLAATLLLLFEKADELYFVLTRRPETLKQHAGQISFPGGRKEPDESFTQTALRETCEELGICDANVQIIGKLTDLYIPPSDFLVHPFVGYLDEEPRWQPDASEVAEVIECPVRFLLDDTLKKRDTANFKGLSFDYFYYDVFGYRVWGATAIMLSEFEWRLRTLLD